jgi:hypothetical protein
MDRRLIDYNPEQYGRLGAMLAALVDIREEEIVSCCREVVDAAFSDSIGRLVLETLLDSYEPMSLGAIAAKCSSGKRSVLPRGRVRIVIERLEKAGTLINIGSEEGKRQYVLDGRTEGSRSLRSCTVATASRRSAREPMGSSVILPVERAASRARSPVNRFFRSFLPG